MPERRGANVIKSNEIGKWGCKIKKSRAPREKGGCKTIKSGQNLHKKKAENTLSKILQIPHSNDNFFSYSVFNPVNDSNE